MLGREYPLAARWSAEILSVVRFLVRSALDCSLFQRLLTLSLLREKLHVSVLGLV